MPYNIQLTDYVARVELTVRESLRGARVIALIESDIHGDEGYWERVYYVAWQRTDQCGTHRVCIDSKWHQACFIGHYDMTVDQALRDMIDRTTLTL